MLPLKDDVMRFRVNSAEKRLIERAAGRARLSPSAWLRQLALKAAEQSDANDNRPYLSPKEFKAEILRRLDGIDDMTKRKARKKGKARP